MTNKNLILELINEFDKSYQQLNNNINCFTYNLSDFARSSLINYNNKGKLAGKLIAVKDNINIKDYPTTCVSKILEILDLGYIKRIEYIEISKVTS